MNLQIGYLKKTLRNMIMCIRRLINFIIEVSKIYEYFGGSFVEFSCQSWLEGEKEILPNLLLKSGVYIENIFFS